MCRPSAGVSTSSPMRRQEAGQRLAGAGRRDQQRCRPARAASSISSWCRRGRPAARRRTSRSTTSGRGWEPFGHRSHIASQWRRLGSWIEAFPRRHLREAGRRLGRSVAAQAAARWSRTAMPIMPAAATAQVWATPETLAIMDVPLRRRSTGSPVAYGETIRIGEVDVSFVPAGHVLGSAQIVLEHARRAGRRLGRLQAPPRPDLRAVRSRCRATSSSPRRRSACRSSAIPTPAARSTGCCTACTPSRSAACWSAPMRSARRSG